ncbi:MAG: hypothetical protein JWL96_4523 [Sphingomonas bacterium]|uniref:Spy/CpxP family protein refolding chaperone n=1 Tax=Sphingomonas bacterium TaxID=1895847 RepID=UPI00260CC881|nr:Spy/CpxP family protein refolding chaperone [Sphingomonas bacterium]MDB5712453.1 hypothetical protein [Sphingomonas bacterium]
MTLKPMLAALLITAALPAAAQTASAAPARPRHDPAMMQQRRADMQQHFANMRQHRADDLALLLDLKPGQRSALDAFLKASHPGMGASRMGRPPEGAPPGATPPGFTERLDRMEAATTRHADAARERIGAIKAFYTSLDPHQKQLFDALRRMRHGGGMGSGGGMGHGGAMGGHMRGGHPGDHVPMGGPEAPQG